MHFVRNISRHLFISNPTFNKSYQSEKLQSASKRLQFQLTRSVTTYNDAGPIKNRPPNKEERLAANEAKKRQDAFNRLMAAFQNQTSLPPEQWTKNYGQKPSSSGILYLLDIFKMLKPPINSLETAKNFLKAYNIERHIVIDGIFLELYAKQYKEGGLTKTEEKEVLEMFVTLL